MAYLMTFDPISATAMCPTYWPPARTTWKGVLLSPRARSSCCAMPSSEVAQGDGDLPTPCSTGVAGESVIITHPAPALEPPGPPPPTTAAPVCRAATSAWVIASRRVASSSLRPDTSRLRSQPKPPRSAQVAATRAHTHEASMLTRWHTMPVQVFDRSSRGPGRPGSGHASERREKRAWGPQAPENLPAQRHIRTHGDAVHEAIERPRQTPPQLQPDRAPLPSSRSRSPRHDPRRIGLRIAGGPRRQAVDHLLHDPPLTDRSRQPAQRPRPRRTHGPQGIDRQHCRLRGVPRPRVAFGESPVRTRRPLAGRRGGAVGDVAPYGGAAGQWRSSDVAVGEREGRGAVIQGRVGMRVRHEWREGRGRGGAG